MANGRWLMDESAISHQPSARRTKMSPRTSDAAVGFTVKSGWASVVLVVRSAGKPHVLDSRRVELSDPAMPESRQPYHAAFGTARASGPELLRLIAAVKRFGRQSITTAIRAYRAGGHRVRGAGVVVGSLIDPKRIANDHIRIHALEGQLFCSVVQEAAVRTRLRCSIWRERDLQALAVSVLKQPEGAVRQTVASLGRDVGGPWRAGEKAAPLAAWRVGGRRPSRARPPRNQAAEV